jgi:hypothetical protein
VTGPDPHPADVPDMDSFFDVLSHRTCREVVFYFECVSDDDTATVAALVAYLSERRRLADPDSIELGLVHRHVPRLAECGWAEYDHRTETVVYHGHDSARYLLTRALELFERT